MSRGNSLLIGLGGSGR